MSTISLPRKWECAYQSSWSKVDKYLTQFLSILAMSLFFGLERQRSHKPVGFGTYIFVAVGSCGLAIIACKLNPGNPLPLLSGVVTGIGFLGAGALIKTGDKVYGFTTAASIWIFAILGILIGLGYYGMSLVVYSFIWIIILIDKYLESRGFGSHRRKITIKTNKIIDEKEIQQVFVMLHNDSMISMEINKSQNTMTIKYFSKTYKETIGDILKVFHNLEWLDSFNIE